MVIWPQLKKVSGYRGMTRCDSTGRWAFPWHCATLEYVEHVYLVCGVAVPNNEFAILGGADQKPGTEKGRFNHKISQNWGLSMRLQAQQNPLKSLQLLFYCSVKNTVLFTLWTLLRFWNPDKLCATVDAFS